jgi:Leucine-rich repeat (LRR) protein
MLSRNALPDLKVLSALSLPRLQTFSLFSNSIKTETNCKADFEELITMIARASPGLTSLNLSGNPLVDEQINLEVDN